MKKQPPDNNYQIIGFDLGHAETSIAAMEFSSNLPPSLLDIQGRKKMITAIGKHPEKGFVVGEQVFRDSVYNPKIYFKTLSSTDEKSLQDYLITYHTKIINKDTKVISRNSEKEYYYFVGCPSGWNEEQITKYEKILKSEIVPNLKVVKESRAALVQAKSAGKISLEEARSSIVVIDIGSSTTDVTYFFAGRENKLNDSFFETGIELGGAIIDEQIFEYNLQRQTNKEELVNFFTDPKHEPLKIKCLFACQRTKEKCSNNEELHRSDDTSEETFLHVKNGINFEISINPAEISNIINSPLPKLNNKSWAETFEELLEKIKYFLDEKRAVPEVIVLTGGMSQMSFIYELAKKHFKYTEKIILHSPPEETVAQGLALWGKIYLTTTAFSEEIREFCEENILEIVENYKSNLLTKLSEEIANSLATSIIKPVLISWRDGSIKTINEIRKEADKKGEIWFQSTNTTKLIKPVITKNSRPIIAEINEFLRDICGKYGIPQASLQLDIDFPFNDDFPKIEVREPLGGVFNIAKIIGYIIMVIVTLFGKGALLTGNIPGWLGYLSFAGLITTFGTMILEEKINDTDIPIKLREMALSNEKMEEIISESVTKVTNKIEKTLEEEHLNKIIESISHQIRQQLDTRVNEVKWIIA